MDFKKMRHEAGLTQEQVETQLLIPKRTQQDWEAGKRIPAPWAVRLLIIEFERLKSERHYLAESGREEKRAGKHKLR